MRLNGSSGGPRRAAESSALAFARSIIGRVSRTFAIGITILPGDLGKAVLTGYLLCRIADTIEDDGSSPAPRRQELLAKFMAFFREPPLSGGGCGGGPGTSGGEPN